MVDIENLRNRIEGFYGKMPDIMFDCLVFKFKEESRGKSCLIVPVRLFLLSENDESCCMEWQIKIGKTIAEKYGAIFEAASIHSMSGDTKEMCFIFPVDDLDDAMARAGMIANALVRFQNALNWTRRWTKRELQKYVDAQKEKVGLEAVGLSPLAHKRG